VGPARLLALMGVLMFVAALASAWMSPAWPAWAVVGIAVLAGATASDGLYCGRPDPADNFGVNLGSIGGHGEVGALIISPDNLPRMSWNPFFP
jgi:hypothetical protein